MGDTLSTVLIMRGLVAILFITFALEQRCIAKTIFTSLSIENHPCRAENLKVAKSYFCDTRGNIICQSGWNKSEEIDDWLNPCSEPICSKGCQNGKCVGPDLCACEIGWEDQDCGTCLRRPGCQHGYCDDAFECKCDLGWDGADCGFPMCAGCNNGNCVSPNECHCFHGWNGDNCTTCERLPGCQHGGCSDKPHTCDCENGWKGILCDEPICKSCGDHGTCVHIDDTVGNICVCEEGWEGQSCNQCIPYWECPNKGKNSCRSPGECHCPEGTKDEKNLCSELF